MTNEMPFLPRVASDPESPKEKFLIILIGLIIGGFMIFLFLPAKARADIVDLNTIKQIESAGNPLAVSRAGAIGLYQIMPCVLEEYNNFNKVNYSRLDLFNPQVNTIIAKWYLTKRIPQMLRHYGKEVSEKNILICYNAGIRAVVKGYLPEETRRYIKKYAKLQKGSV